MFFGIVGLFGAFALDLQSRESDESKTAAKREQFYANWAYQWKQQTSDDFIFESQKELAKNGNTQYYKYCVDQAEINAIDARAAKKSWIGFAQNIDRADDEANSYRNFSYAIG